LKSKTFSFGGKDIHYTVYNLDDLLNTDIFRMPLYVWWKRFFKVEKETNNERVGRKMAKMIVNLFLKELMNDLIYQNDTFVLPEKGLGFIAVTNKTNYQSETFQYDFETEGKTYGPKIFISKEQTKKTKKLYRMRFTQIGRRKVREQIAKKHYYA